MAPEKWHRKNGTGKMAPAKMAPAKMAQEKNGTGENGTGENGTGKNGTRKKWLPELTAPEKMAPGSNGRVPNLESAVCTSKKKKALPAVLSSTTMYTTPNFQITSN